MTSDPTQVAVRLQGGRPDPAQGHPSELPVGDAAGATLSPRGASRPPPSMDCLTAPDPEKPVGPPGSSGVTPPLSPLLQAPGLRHVGLIGRVVFHDDLVGA
jgi:hypothetical protein